MKINYGIFENPVPMEIDLTSIDLDCGFNLKDDRFEGIKMQSNIRKHKQEVLHTQVSMTPVSDALLKYYEECAEIVYEKTNADIVFVNGHLSRSEGLGKIDINNLPAKCAHSDYCDQQENLFEFQKRFFKQQIENKQPIPEGAIWINGSREKVLDCKRMETYNIWRNLSEDGKMDLPLCICHPSSINFENDVIFSPKTFTLRNGYTSTYLNAFFKPEQENANKHKWYSYTDLDDTEVVLFKQYDSTVTEKDYVLMHGGISSSIGNVIRESVEVRIWCYYGT